MPYLDAAGWVQRGESGQSIVALGGGHGLSATLRALRHITRALTAVVTVADDGGSSGRLRQEMPILPPGDLRMALASLCEESEWGLTWRDVMQLRLDTTGPLNGHALGNLLISGLWQLLDDPVEGLDWVGRLLGAQGRVLPMSTTPIDIEADMNDGGRRYVVAGQSKVAVAPGTVEHVRITPEAPAVPGAVIDAISEADWVVLGPGSWYTSVIPHLLVPEINRALATTDAHRALVLNLARQRGETDRCRPPTTCVCCASTRPSQARRRRRRPHGLRRHRRPHRCRRGARRTRSPAPGSHRRRGPAPRPAAPRRRTT